MQILILTIKLLVSIHTDKLNRNLENRGGQTIVLTIKMNCVIIYDLSDCSRNFRVSSNPGDGLYFFLPACASYASEQKRLWRGSITSSLGLKLFELPFSSTRLPLLINQGSL